MTTPRALLSGLVAGGVLLAALVGAPAGSADPAPADPAPAVDAPPSAVTSATTSAALSDRQARVVSLRLAADGGLRVVSDVTMPAADAPRLGAVEGERARVLLETADGTQNAIDTTLIARRN